MTFIYHGKLQDSTKELEIFPKNEFGDNAIVIFKNGRSEIYHNLTEVHYLFDSIFKTPACAFESDIHGNGCTRDLDKLELIVVYPAVQLENEF